MTRRKIISTAAAGVAAQSQSQAQTPSARHYIVMRKLFLRNSAENQVAKLTEFLETPTSAPVSSQHAFWLACLLWMGKRGASLQMASGAQGVECRLVQADAALTPSQLAAWVEQF